nr:stage II sporulation protein M [Acidimicrobiia bacterium]
MPEPLPDFVDARQAAWDDLADLVDRARGRIGRLDAPSVRRLGRRYRQAAADLAQARRRFPGDPVTTRLDRLVRDARPLVYGTVTERQSMRSFATTGYWRRVRERPVFLLIAALALWAPAILVGVWAHAKPADGGRAAQISPLSSGAGQSAPRDPDTQKITDPVENTAFSAQIFTNNARVALLAYAGGLLGGVGTLATLIYNGLVLGLVAGLAVEGGYSDSIWRLVVPHGVLELSLITAAGAAGLRTGWALVHPCHRSRVEALVEEGRAGVELALGSAVLLVPTGLVEGFVTPRGLSLPAALT